MVKCGYIFFLYQRKCIEPAYLSLSMCLIPWESLKTFTNNSIVAKLRQLVTLEHWPRMARCVSHIKIWRWYVVAPSVRLLVICATTISLCWKCWRIRLIILCHRFSNGINCLLLYLKWNYTHVRTTYISISYWCFLTYLVTDIQWHFLYYKYRQEYKLVFYKKSTRFKYFKNYPDWWRNVFTGKCDIKIKFLTCHDCTNTRDAYKTPAYDTEQQNENRECVTLIWALSVSRAKVIVFSVHSMCRGCEISSVRYGMAGSFSGRVDKP